MDWPVATSAWIFSSSLISAQKEKRPPILWGPKFREQIHQWICVPDPITKADLRRHGECINFRKCFLITFFWRIAAQLLSRTIKQASLSSSIDQGGGKRRAGMSLEGN